MNILGLDASSSVVGYAVMSGPDTLLDAGRILGLKKLAALERIDLLCAEVAEMIARVKRDFSVQMCVLEISSGHVARRLGGRAAGMQTLGAGIALVRRTAVVAGLEVVTITENEWTRSVPKEKRALWQASRFPQHAAAFAADVGHDMADAIGVLSYWFQRQEILRGQPALASERTRPRRAHRRAQP